jgi:hypothetical protein
MEMNLAFCPNADAQINEGADGEAECAAKLPSTLFLKQHGE